MSLSAAVPANCAACRGMREPSAPLCRANAPAKVITVSSGGMLTEALHVRPRDGCSDQHDCLLGPLTRTRTRIGAALTIARRCCLPVQVTDMEWANGGFSGTRQYARDK